MPDQPADDRSLIDSFTHISRLFVAIAQYSDHQFVLSSVLALIYTDWSMFDAVISKSHHISPGHFPSLNQRRRTFPNSFLDWSRNKKVTSNNLLCTVRVAPEIRRRNHGDSSEADDAVVQVLVIWAKYACKKHWGGIVILHRHRWIYLTPSTTRKTFRLLLLLSLLMY